MPDNDTIINFNGLNKFHSEADRLIERDNKVLYMQFLYSNSSVTQSELFRIDGSQYYYIEYYPDGNIKTKGTYQVTDSVTHVDTITTVYPYPPYDDHIIALCYKDIYKSGAWTEYSEYNQRLPLLDFWHGKYSNGKKTGIWTQQTAVNGIFEIARIDYDSDSTKSIHVDNRIYLPLDSLKKRIIGKWHDFSCLSKDSSRIEIRKCFEIRGTNRIQCYDGNQQPDHYEFLKGEKLEIQSKANCAIFSGQTNISNWTLLEDNGIKFLEFKSLDKTRRFKILYINDQGIMLLEWS